MAVFFSHFLITLKENHTSKNSDLLVSEILRLFVNILTPDDMYSLSRKPTVSRNQFKCNYLQIKKYFLNFLLHFRNLHEIWNTLKKMLNLGGHLFLKLQIAKSGVTEMPKSLVSELLRIVNMLRGTKHCLSLHGSIFVKFLYHSQKKASRKTLFQQYLKSWDCLFTY